MFRLWMVLFAFLVIVAGCRSSPEAEVSMGDILVHEHFDSAIGWDNQSHENVAVGVEAGAYRIRADVDTFVRGFNNTTYGDVVIDVEVVQLTYYQTNAFGVLCRADGDDITGNGYYFLIGSDGMYSIRKGQQGEVKALVEWSHTDAIHQGSGTNRIRAICVEDYLALYVNDQFVNDVRDDTYSRGFIGFTAATETGTNIDVAFDNLIIHEAVLAEQ